MTVDNNQVGPTDEELTQAMYEVAGVYVEGGEYHCRRADMPRIARNILSRYAAPQDSAERRKPDGYAYRYHDGVRALRFNNGEPINGCMPFEAVPYYLGTAPAAEGSAKGVGYDPTDPGHDVDTLIEHVRHLERRLRQLYADREQRGGDVGDVELPPLLGDASRPGHTYTAEQTARYAHAAVLADRQKRGGDVVRYDGLYDYAAAHGLDYNGLCRVARAALSEQEGK